MIPRQTHLRLVRNAELLLGMRRGQGHVKHSGAWANFFRQTPANEWIASQAVRSIIFPEATGTRLGAVGGGLIGTVGGGVLGGLQGGQEGILPGMVMGAGLGVPGGALSGRIASKPLSDAWFNAMVKADDLKLKAWDKGYYI